MAEQTIPMPQGAQVVDSSTMQPTKEAAAAVAPAAPSSEKPVPIPKGAQVVDSATLNEKDNHPGFLSTLGSDVASAVSGAAKFGANVLTYHNDPEADRQRQELSEAHKSAVYEQFRKDISAGNYVQGLRGLSDLFTTEYDDPNDPIHQMLDAQLSSSRQAKDRMIQAAKAGDTMGVIQHAAGVVPIASQVDEAMTRYQAEPTKQNLAHIITSAIPAFVPSMVRGIVKAAPLVTGAASDITDAASRAISRSADSVEDVAETNAGKAPIAAGSPAVKDAPTLASVQGDVQSALRDNVSRLANENKLKPADPNVSVRDLGKHVGDQFYERSRTALKQIGDETGVNFDDLKTKIDTLNKKIEDADLLGDDTSRLSAKKFMYETQAEDALAKVGDRYKAAKTDWRMYKQSYELGQEIRGATSGRSGVGGGETVDPGKLSSRLHRLNDSVHPGRPGTLPGLLGDQAANDLISGVEKARDSITKFTPTEATGQQAMKDLLVKHTGTGRFAGIKQAVGFSPKTDYISAFGEFNKMPAAKLAEAFGQDAPQARAFLQSAARRQVVALVAKGVGVATIASTLGIPRSILHLLAE